MSKSVDLLLKEQKRIERALRGNKSEKKKKGWGELSTLHVKRAAQAEPQKSTAQAELPLQA